MKIWIYELSVKIFCSSQDLLIYSQNIGGQYIILEERDVKNMVYEDYYVQLTRVIHIHECCSFLTRKKKIPVFPWTDFTVNLIFYIII